MLEDTQPPRRLDRTQAVYLQLPVNVHRLRPVGCWPFALAGLVLIYFFAPLRTNILLLGADDSPQRGTVGRTDTIILTTIVPLKPYIGVLSIPRDLWVSIPGAGEQRINTAYFFAEANQPGSGPPAAMQTIRENFGVPVRYYAVVHMGGLVSVVDALGGVDVRLEAPTDGLPAGEHHLNGDQALAFIRERKSGDDFGRMQSGQVMLISVFSKVLSPASWPRLPQFLLSLADVIDSNIPLWQWPRLLFALLRSFLFGIDNRTIERELVTPFQTSESAQVLAPKWDAIRPLLKDMFGR